MRTDLTEETVYACAEPLVCLIIIVVIIIIMRNLKNDIQLLVPRHKLLIIMAVHRKEIW